MAYKVPSDPQPNELRLQSLIGGLNVNEFESLIKQNQSPYLLNVSADDTGAICKRSGTVNIYTNSLGSGAINGSTIYDDKRVFAWGTGLYYQSGTSDPVSLLTGLANAYMNFQEFNGTLYGINGTDYISYDGLTATASITPYVPTTYINRLYSGGGDAYEQINRLGAGFKNSFNGDASHTTFQLSEVLLDATTVLCTIGGVTKTEGTHFTVNRTAGTINFAAGTSPHGAPASGTNNVIITAYKTVSDNILSIKSNTCMAIYGGTNDTRLFLGGYGNYVFYSALLDPTYFPYNNYNRIGNPSQSITVFSKMYSALIAFKSTEIQSMTYLDESGTVSFPTVMINDAIGCDMPNSVQIINDAPVFCNSYGGVYTLWSNNGIKEEKNVRRLSININGTLYREGLLNQEISDLYEASSCDFEGKYILCVTDKCWVWDYDIIPYQGLMDDGASLSWWYWDNINAKCFMKETDVLYFGSRSIGMLSKFQSNYNDNGSTINAIWRSQLFAFFNNNGYQLTDWYKTILEVWLTTRSNINSSLTIKYLNENQESLETILVPATTLKSFDWANFDWSKFTWGVSNYASTINKKPKLKKIKYFQIELSNNVLNENLSIIYIVISYILSQKVK